MRNAAKQTHHTPKTGRGIDILALMVLITLAFNLRGPLTALSPIIRDLRADLGISSTLVGMLTTIPILCFGILTPFASAFIARVGIEASILTTLGGVTLGTIIRSTGGFAFTLTGTFIIGVALTIGNIVSLMVIARDFPHRTNSVTGIYTSALNVGTMFTSAFTAPLAIFYGWRIATAFWIILALAAVLLKGVAFLRSRGKAQLESDVTPGESDKKLSASADTKDRTTAIAVTPPPRVWKRRIVWMLVVALAVHLFIYYAITAWLPTYLTDSGGMSLTVAGFVASAFQILALVGAFGAPALMSTGRISNAALLIGIAVCWIITPLGILFAQGIWPLWALICGIATGGGFTIIFMLIVEQAYDLNDNRRISSFVQGIAYTLSSLGPLVVGGLHQRYESWTPGFLLLAVLGFFIVAAGIGLRVPRTEQKITSSLR
jgi:CP family cyanate transporter-like MFS transporter